MREFMKKHKKVTYSLSLEVITIINVKYLKELSIGNHISKSSIIRKSIEDSFKVFEEELKNWDTKKNYRKRLFNTIPKTFSLPFEIDEKLNYYSKKLKVKKSHLVIYSIILQESKLSI
jgi:predicted DNA-binding protein YlxM (UPF0122 family)